MNYDLKSYVEKARDDFKKDAETHGNPEWRKTFDICRKRLDAILKRVEEEQADAAATHKQGVLETAHDLIHGDRLQHYGHPNINFSRIAGSWTQYTGATITPMDVCVMMILLKAQRMAEGYHRDSVIDIGGYAALAAIVCGDEEL